MVMVIGPLHLSDRSSISPFTIRLPPPLRRFSKINSNKIRERKLSEQASFDQVRVFVYQSSKNDPLTCGFVGCTFCIFLMERSLQVDRSSCAQAFHMWSQWNPHQVFHLAQFRFNLTLSDSKITEPRGSQTRAQVATKQGDSTSSEKKCAHI